MLKKCKGYPFAQELTVGVLILPRCKERHLLQSLPGFFTHLIPLCQFLFFTTVENVKYAIMNYHSLTSSGPGRSKPD